MDVLLKLESLHREIDQCFACSACRGFCKPRAMDRGAPGDIVIVGEGPGRKELENERAFSGQTGVRLDEWLVASGAPPATPRAGVYTTSVTKCVADLRTFGKAMGARKLLAVLGAQDTNLTKNRDKVLAWLETQGVVRDHDALLNLLRANGFKDIDVEKDVLATIDVEQLPRPTVHCLGWGCRRKRHEWRLNGDRSSSEPA